MNLLCKLYAVALCLLAVACGSDDFYTDNTTADLLSDITPVLKSATSSQIELINDETFQKGLVILDPASGDSTGVIQYTASGETPVWNLAQWYSSSSITGCTPTVLSSGAYQYADANKAVTIGPESSDDGHLILAVNGLNDFGGVYRSSSDPFPHLLADQRIAEPDGWLGTNTPSVGEMTNLNFSVDVKLIYHTRNEASGYNSDIHALQYNCVFLVQNLNQSSSGYGKNMYFMSTIFDDRSSVPGMNIAEDTYSDRLIYDIGLSPFSSTGLTVGTWKTLSADLLPYIKDGLNEAWNRGYLTESTSLNDYKVALFTTGFECSGFNIGTMQIKNLSLTAERTVDYDGNIYHVVEIGGNTWMVENYECTHFSDGTAITHYYHPDDTNHAYGPSYSWNDIKTTGFVPDGWHVATNAEWQALYNYVSGAGVKLKETGTNYWNTGNGSNETGFSALGGAHIYGVALKSEANWWTADENSTSEGLRWTVFDDGTMSSYANSKSMYFPVRLVKD